MQAAFDAAVVLTTSLVLVVVAGSVLPWLALGATSTSVDQLYSTADITAEPRPIDAARVRADARVAHEILVAVSATVGPAAGPHRPLAVSLGVAGAVLAVLCCVVVVLRTRRYRTRSEVLVGLVSGIAGLVSTGIATLWLHPDWRPAVAVVPGGQWRGAARCDDAAVGALGAARPARGRRQVGWPCWPCCRCWWSPSASSPPSGADRGDGHQRRTSWRPARSVVGAW